MRSTRTLITLLPLAGLAFVEGQTYRNIDANPSHLQRAEQFAQRAMAIDPRLAETRLALGTVDADDLDYAAAAPASSARPPIYTRKIAYAWDLLSWALAFQQPPEAAGRGESGTGIHASGAIPLPRKNYYHLGRALILQQRYPEAIAAFEHARELDPADSFPQPSVWDRPI